LKQPSPPPPDPKMEAIKAKAQLDQQKAQMDMQVAEHKLQIEQSSKEQEIQMKAAQVQQELKAKQMEAILKGHLSQAEAGQKMQDVGMPITQDVNNLPQVGNQMQDAYNASVGKLDSTMASSQPQ